MLSKKKKIIVLCSMVALLVVTGVLNIVLNKTSAPPVEGVQDNRSLFQTYRDDRDFLRNQTILELDAAIKSTAYSADAKREAELKLSELQQNALTELELEILVKTGGFDDAFITMSTENINVIVKALEITEDEANRIRVIVSEETGRDATNIVVMPLTSIR
jgi:hypothetical protein